MNKPSTDRLNSPLCNTASNAKKNETTSGLHFPLERPNPPGAAPLQKNELRFFKGLAIALPAGILLWTLIVYFIEALLTGRVK
jgi:hypothetical protein